ncbi:hypothetical protein OPQ81_010634 [Rhizoctonia solani]|nr:hypothetical protein OPQ81_010634 [Rhizoctonia solani]
MENSILHPTTPTTAEFKRFVRFDSKSQEPISIGHRIRHPEGGYIFYDGRIVSPHPLTEALTSAANCVLNSLAEGTDDVTLVVNLRELIINYYVVSHQSKRIVWAPGHSIEGICQNLEYWVHMRNFPSPRFSTPDDISEFQRVLGNNMLHFMYPNPKPERLRLLPSQIINRLDDLKLASSKNDSCYGTFRIAGFWVSVIRIGATTLPEHKSLRSGQFDINAIQKRFNDWWSGHPDNQHFSSIIEAENQGQIEDIQATQTVLIDNSVHTISTNLKMSTNEVLELLKMHKCKDVTTQLVESPISACPNDTGGVGEVYRAVMHCGTEVSLKCLRPAIESDDNGRKLLKLTAHELYVWSKCHHPNVLDLIGVANLRETLFMVSPWMIHGNLRDYLAGKLHCEEICYKMCWQVSDGVAYLHSGGIVHGDLKCHNIVVSGDGTPKITDFGTATMNEYSLFFTKSGMEANITPRWTAPEILKQHAKSTAHSDVYSLGMTILEAFTGAVPYAGIPNLMHVVVRIVRGEKPMRPATWECVKTELLWELLVRCWAYDPPERPDVISIRDQVKEISLRMQP